MAVEDPRPILELLWDGVQAPRRGPRHSLTVERIVGAATEIAEEQGIAALSMRGVAARLGVSATSLYTYVPDKGALLAVMLDSMVAEATLPHTLPGNWRDKVVAWAEADLRGYRSHPWVIDLLAAAHPVGPGAMAWMDSAMRAFDHTGLTDREILAVIEAVDCYVRGIGVRAVDADRTARRRARDGRSWSDAEQDYLASRPELGSFPAISRLADTGPSVDEVFEEGLSFLLDGIERRIRSAAR